MDEDRMHFALDKVWAASGTRDDQSRSIVFVSQSTSATGSMMRISRTVFGKKFRIRQTDLKNPRRSDRVMLNQPPPSERGYLFFVNQPHFLSSSWISPKYKYIISSRDPRDRLCNMYHWQFSHPVPGETAEERAKRIEKARKAGIDRWVILTLRQQFRDHTVAYDTIRRILEEHPGQCLVLTYARLCLDFDDFIRRLSHFAGIPVTKRMLKRLEIERPENLGDNPKWVGNRWEGSDVMPGRYKRELQPETIEIINEKMKPYLRQMAKYDPDYAHLYLEGL